MNNLKKVGLTALAGALVSVSVNAADLAVTGGASIGFGGEEAQTTGNGWYMNDGVTFSASEAMDWGTLSLSFLLDSGDTGGTSPGLDNRSLTFDMEDNGVLTFSGDGGDGVLSAMDDKMPTAYEESWDLVTGADIAPSGPNGLNMFHYSNSTLYDGLELKLALVPSDGATQIESSMDYGLTYTGIENLEVGIAQGENNVTAATSDITNMYVTYTLDNFSVGYQASEDDSETADADKDFNAFAISYVLPNGDTQISLGSSTIDFENSTLSDQEATGLSVSHTMGAMTLTAAHNSVDNIAGAAASDRSGYDIALGFAF